MPSSELTGEERRPIVTRWDTREAGGVSEPRRPSPCTWT